MIVAHENTSAAEKVLIGKFFALPNGNYYPFGKESRGSSTSNRPKEQFTGKERDTEIGLDYFGARYYNAEIGRWTSVDPMAKERHSWTPYNYVRNNPLLNIDPTGALDGDYYDKNWNYVGSDGKDDGKVYVRTAIPGEKTERDLYIGQAEEVFTTGHAGTDSRILSLHPAIRPQATQLVNQSNQSSDATVIIAQGLRTNEEQDALYAQGRTESGEIVTNAKGGESNHNYGLAFDVAGVKDGQLTYDLDWTTLGATGAQLGFDWGGNWEKFQDKPHFENTFGYSTDDLAKKKEEGKTQNGYVNIHE